MYKKIHPTCLFPELAKLTQLPKHIAKILKQLDMVLSTATVVCKAITTAGWELGEKEKVALVHSMSHTKATADTYYRAYEEAKSLEGFQCW